MGCARFCRSDRPYARGAGVPVGAALVVLVRFIPTRVGLVTRPSRSRSISFGSSPHAWGWSKYASLIPSRNTVHPHTRGAGEHQIANPPICSPVHPHTRGAGEFHRSSRFAPETVHPHTRGAGGKRKSDPLRIVGSSPHAWGWYKLTSSSSNFSTVHPHTRGAGEPVSENLVFVMRFIPTRVGLVTVTACSSTARSGSSPHAWGW